MSNQTTMMRASLAVAGAAAVLALGAISMSAWAQQAGSPAGAKASVDAEADRHLRAMSDFLGGLKAFRMEADHVTEVVTDAGERLQFLASSEVLVQRPNRLRSDRRGELAAVSFYYDGKSVTIYGRRAAMYATAPAPSTLDKTIDYAREKLDLEAPAADLLYSNVYAVLMEDVVSGKYIGTAELHGETCHHLAFRGNETDWQIWVREGDKPVPCRFVIVSKKVEGQPEFAVDLHNWDLQPKVSADQFTFKAPADAKRIDFLTAKSQSGKPPKDATPPKKEKE